MSYFKDFLSGRTAKTTPVDADNFLLGDSADSNKTKKVTWANIKATLAAAFGLTAQNVYEATLTQTSTGAPSATVANKTIVGTFTLARTSAGLYTLTSTGTPFTANKTQVYMPNSAAMNGQANLVQVSRTSTSVITIETFVLDDSPLLANSDGILSETAIRIVVTP